MSRRPLALAAAIFASLAAAAPAAAAPSDLVISQVYGGGGNSGATFQNDYVELLNRGTTGISLAGRSIQYASASGTGAFGNSSTQLTPLPDRTLAPGEYLLVAGAAGTNASPALPAPDVTDDTPINLSGSAGKVVVAEGTDALGCNGGSTPCSPEQTARIIDLVGYGTANYFEGTAPAPGLSNTTAALRAAAGCTDTDQNGSDFTAGEPAPRNSSSPDADCGGGPDPEDDAPAVTETDPADGDANVPTDSDVTVTFSEDVTVADGGFGLTCSDSGAKTLTVTGGPRTFTLDPAEGFEASETCTVTVGSGAVSDQDATDPPDGLAADFSASFSTAGLALRIPEIQGAEHRSPFEGESVADVPGVVTAVRSNGFYLQDPTSDGDDETSQGIFVFTGSAPSVGAGDALTVSGRVSEFRPGGGSSANLTITQIGSPAITPAGTGTIAPTVVGRDGRRAPTTVIDNDSFGDVELGSTFDPEQDGIDFYESLEGMLTEVRSAIATGPTNDFGEISVLPDLGFDATGRTQQGGIVVSEDDFNPERIFLDDSIAPTPTVNLRDSFSNPVRAVVDYSFGNYKFQVLNELRRFNGRLAPEVTATPSSSQLATATFNVENLDPADGNAKFSRLARILVTNMKSPDLVSLEEVQDNDGAASPSPTAADQTYAKFIAAIKAAGGPTYEYRQIDPQSNQDGGEPNGNIRVGFLFRTDRGLAFVDRPGGDATTPTAEDGSQPGAQLTLSPGRIQPNDPAFDNSRKPLAGEFTFRGKRIIAVANHFNSKGGDQPLFGRFQPPARPSEVQRHKQAKIVSDFTADVLAADPNANVIVLGDLNDFEFSRTLEILQGGRLSNLILTLPKPERWTYIFEGNSQVLDHILVSRALRPSAVYDSVHVNAPFADQVSDHDPQVARLRVTAGG